MALSFFREAPDGQRHSHGGSATVARTFLAGSRNGCANMVSKALGHFTHAQTSTMYAATHARGGSNSLLWISELGYIQATDLRRSEEILTGAIPSAKNGTIVVETTWRVEGAVIYGRSLKRPSRRLTSGSQLSPPSGATWVAPSGATSRS